MATDDRRLALDPRFRSGPPANAAHGLPAVPDALVGLLADATSEQIWVKRESEVWRVERASDVAYLKIMDDLGPWAEEVARLRWCVDRCPVATPSVLGEAVDEIGRGWFLATEVPGTPSHHPTLVAPGAEPLIDGLALGLRAFHDAGSGPAPPCPFRLAIDDLLASASRRVAAGGVDPSSMRSPTYQRMSAENLLDRLVATRPDELDTDQVVTHGDPCQPNLLVDPTAPGGLALAGMVDLGRLAVTDRHRDLAIAARSLDQNLGPKAAARFLAAYGLETPDRERLAWWTLVDDLW